MFRKSLLPSLIRDFDNIPTVSFFENMNDIVYEKNSYRLEESEKEYSIEIDMPGVKKEDLEIGIKDNILTIKAERKKISKDEEKKEFIARRYEESFSLNTKGIETEGIGANLEHGILTITLPKKEEVKYEKRIEIK